MNAGYFLLVDTTTNCPTKVDAAKKMFKCTKTKLEN